MKAALAPLFGAGLTVAGCYAAGSLALAALKVSPTRSEKYPLAFVLGAGLVHLAVFVILAAHAVYQPVLLALLGGLVIVAAASGAWRLGRGAPQGDRPRSLFQIFCFLLFAVFTVYYFVNAWAPEGSPDGSGYHLGLVARYVREHGFVPIPTDMYSGLGQGVELLFLAGFAFGRNSAGSLVHLAFAIALVLAMIAYGKRIGKPNVGFAGALLTYLSPIVGKDGSSAYIDVAVAAIVFSVFYWLDLWDESRDARLLIPIGLMAGYAFAAKYTAAAMIAYALGFLAWRARKARPLFIAGACAALMIAPWMLKNWIYLHNPVAPFADEIFRNPNFHPLAIQSYSEYLRRYDVANKWTLPLEVTVRGFKTQGVIGPVFLLAPLALLAVRERAGRRLLVPGFLMLATYLANIGTRFLIPSLPFFSLAMTLALGNTTWLLAGVVVAHAVLSWPAILPHYVQQYAWTLDSFPYRSALRKISEDQYLRKINGSYAVVRMIEANVPAGERVLSPQALPYAFTSREILVSYEASLNALLMDGLYTGWIPGYQATRKFVFRFPERRMHRVRILQTARAPEGKQWDVNEVRFLHRGAELARKPEWRLRAFPNSWEVQVAFDNSPSTRWRSWETVAPGMYIDVDFGSEEAIDEVQVETSPDATWAVRLVLEAMEAPGNWAKVADNPALETAEVRGSVRRAATYEMNARGVNYLLVGDDDYGAKEYGAEPEAWGLKPVARAEGRTLYRVVP